MNINLNNLLTTIIVGCHKDKALKDAPVLNPWEIQIQAGAALTDARIYPKNDHDDFPESISDRNQRYSEMTAVWWAYHHINTPYIGIEHYRRRFSISPQELENELINGVDVITLKKVDLGTPMTKQMKCFEYTSVLYVFLDIIKEFHPEDMELTQEILNGTTLRGCNMNIWKVDVFKEYCEWLFPMLDAFYQRIPSKTDTYLRRDVGFAAELLSYIFIEKMIKKGVRVSETWFNKLVSIDTEEKTEIDYTDPEAVIKNVNYYFELNRLIDCWGTLVGGINQTHDSSIYERYYERPIQVFNIFDKERTIADTTLLDYLPAKERATINDTVHAINKLETNIKQLLIDPSAKKEKAFTELVKYMDYSGVIIWLLTSSIADNFEIAQYIAAILNDAQMTDKAGEVIYSANSNISY